MRIKTLFIQEMRYMKQLPIYNSIRVSTSASGLEIYYFNTPTSTISTSVANDPNDRVTTYNISDIRHYYYDIMYQIDLDDLAEGSK